MLVSVLISAKSDQGVPLQIRHLIIEGSSQWVIGRNVTRFCNIHHFDRNCLMFRSPVSDELLSMSLYDVGDHCYLPFSTFESTQSRHVDKCLVSLSCSVQTSDLLWSDRKRIIDKVHRHVCGHSSYEDIKLMLSRNELWNKHCAKYLSHILDTHRECFAFKAPIGSRKVSLSSVSQDFNDLVCVDHFFLENLDVFRIMDARKRYSVGSILCFQRSTSF